MSGTTADIWAIISVGVVSLAAMLLLVVWYAPTHPAHKYPDEQTRGLVQGGQHVGGGRSVGPHRDAPVPEGQTVPSPRSPGVEDEEKEQVTGGFTSSGSPMDP
jgi:hypothetical protein